MASLAHTILDYFAKLKVKIIRVPGIPHFCQIGRQSSAMQAPRFNHLAVSRMVAETWDPWNSIFFRSLKAQFTVATFRKIQILLEKEIVRAILSNSFCSVSTTTFICKRAETKTQKCHNKTLFIKMAQSSKWGSSFCNTTKYV